jgi:hypothetical protein
MRALRPSANALPLEPQGPVYPLSKYVLATTAGRRGLEGRPAGRRALCCFRPDQTRSDQSVELKSNRPAPSRATYAEKDAPRSNLHRRRLELVGVILNPHQTGTGLGAGGSRTTRSARSWLYRAVV